MSTNYNTDPRNYNTTLGIPYIRVNQLVVKYNASPENRAQISFSEDLALLDSEQNIHLLQGFADNISETLSLNEIATGQFDIIDVATGAPTGDTMTTLALYVALTSFLRKLQNEKYPPTAKLAAAE